MAQPTAVGSSHGFPSLVHLSFRMTARYVVTVNSHRWVDKYPTLSARTYCVFLWFSGDGAVLLSVRKIGDRLPARGGFHPQECHPSLCLHHRCGLLPVGRPYLCEEDRREQGVICDWAFLRAIQEFEGSTRKDSRHGLKSMAGMYNEPQTEQLGGPKAKNPCGFIVRTFFDRPSLLELPWLGSMPAKQRSYYAGRRQKTYSRQCTPIAPDSLVHPHPR